MTREEFKQKLTGKVISNVILSDDKASDWKGEDFAINVINFTDESSILFSASPQVGIATVWCSLWIGDKQIKVL